MTLLFHSVTRLTGDIIGAMENAGTPPSQSQVQSQSHRTPSTEWTHVATNPVPQPDSAVMTPNGDSSDPKSPPTKRRRADRERTRVSRACDRCKRKKTRCTGRCPCALCLRSGLPCEFTASYTRGRLPSVIVDEAALAASSQPRIPMPGQVSTPGSSPKDSTTPTFQFQGPLPTPTLDRSSANDILTRSDQLNEPDIKEAPREIVSRNSPEPTQTDQQGHYVGSSSAVSFLLRIQKRLHQNSSLSHDSTIFTFGDAPLPEFDPTFFVLPPKGDAQRLVERYFDFAAPTHRFLHRASMEKLLHEFYDTQGDMRSKEDAAAKTALLFIVFAQGQAYMPPGSTTHENRSSARYFFASEHQLSKERGAVRLASVQARLGQCFYLLSQSRINHCWSLFGTTAHLALAIGLHRGRRCNPSAGVDYVELECRKRCFWSMYTLDKYLAAALGRPRTFKDEDIDQELPIVVNDNDLQPLSINPPSKISHYSEMMAPVEHIKLSRIISLVLRDLYPIRPPSLPLRAELAAKYTCDLHAWRSSLSRFLDSSTIDTSLLIPLYQRQRSVLNLGYYHAMLLIHRPFLLSNFASLTWIDPTRPGPAGHGNSHTSSTDTSFPPNNHHHHPLNANVDTSQNTTQCLEAAMNIVRVVDEIFNSSQIFRVFWFTQYYAFCAVVVLYIYRIQQHLVTPGKCEGYFAAGQKCQKQLETVSETDCLARRYCLVLEELRLEAVRQSHAVGGSGASSTNNSTTATTATGFSTNNTTDSLQNPPTNLSVPGSTPQSDTSPNSGIPGSFYTSTGTGTIPPTPESTAFNTSYLPSSSVMADLTSWGQFDSLVTAGIGMLDGSLSLQGDAAGFGFGFGL